MAFETVRFEELGVHKSLRERESRKGRDEKKRGEDRERRR